MADTAGRPASLMEMKESSSRSAGFARFALLDGSGDGLSGTAGVTVSRLRPEAGKHSRSSSSSSSSAGNSSSISQLTTDSGRTGKDVRSLKVA